MSFCFWVDLSKSCFSQVRYNLNRSNLLRRDGSTFSNILSLHLDASIPHAFGQFAAQNISACVIDAQHDFQSVVRDTFAVLRQITCCVETIIYHDYCALFSPSFTGPEVDVGGTWTVIQTWKEIAGLQPRWSGSLWGCAKLCECWTSDISQPGLRFFSTIHFHGFGFGGPKPLGGNFWFFNNSFSTTFVWVSNYSHHRFVGQPSCWVCPPRTAYRHTSLGWVLVPWGTAWRGSHESSTQRSWISRKVGSTSSVSWLKRSCLVIRNLVLAEIFVASILCVFLRWKDFGISPIYEIYWNL